MITSQGQRGMTLIELILAIGVLAMISSITYGAIANAAAVGEEAQAQRQLRTMGRNATRQGTRNKFEG